MSTNPWLDAALDVVLESVAHYGETFCGNQWNALAACDAQPNGAPVPPVPISELTVPYNGPVNLNDLPIYAGPGGYCGADAPEGVLHLGVSVTGTASDGSPLAGGTDAYFSLPPDGSNQVCIVTVVIPHPKRRIGKGANLWFTFRVRSVC